MKSLILVSLVCAMLIFGCTGEQKQQAPSNNAGGGQPKGDSGAGENSGGSQASQPEKSPLDSLLGLFGLNSGWKATYELSGTGMQGVSEMTQYVKGIGKIRIDATASNIELRTYFLGSDMYSCTKQGSWGCLKFSVPKTEQTDSSQLSYDLKNKLKENAAKYSVSADGTMQVAGVTATCFRVTSDEANVRYCVSPEGVPLYMLTTAKSEGKNAEFLMKAKSYSTSVSDSDFALPAEPIEFTLPSALGNGSDFEACSLCSYLDGDEKAKCLASC
ncbi:MAG: hypothetical protein QW568_02070 [Candidatus Anstonellaceae archaeon]